jgi:type II secretory pathway pseudopilin PulG
MKRGGSLARDGFSLVEVVIAIGIVAFAFIAIISLIPVGMQINRDSTEESRAMNLLQAIVADRQAASWSSNSPVYDLPALSGVTTPTSGTLWVNEDGTTNAGASGALYKVSYTIYPSAGYMQPAFLNLGASWPAAATNASRVEIVSTFLQ